MPDEQGFLQAIQASPHDDSVRLVYADWLEERGDIRAEFLRLHLALASLSPDHLHRSSGEHELSFLRNQIDAAWLAIVEPERLQSPEPYEPRCGCFDAGYRPPGTYDEHFRPKWPEMQLHVETQDTECDAWIRLLDLIERAAADGREEFAPLENLEPGQRADIVTLPPTIAKLKTVKKLDLYRSHLVRIPPEIGEMSSLEEFDPYTSYRLHWYPYEITRCKNLRRSRMSTRALYGNRRYRPPFPLLKPRTTSANGRVEPERLSLKRWKTESVRNCSVCNQPLEDRRQHRVWISLHLASHDVFPLLVNACSEECIRSLPRPPEGYVQVPHRGGPTSVAPGVH